MDSLVHLRQLVFCMSKAQKNGSSRSQHMLGCFDSLPSHILFPGRFLVLKQTLPVNEIPISHFGNLHFDFNKIEDYKLCGQTSGLGSFPRFHKHVYLAGAPREDHQEVNNCAVYPGSLTLLGVSWVCVFVMATNG